MTFESDEEAQQAYKYLREDVKEFQVNILLPSFRGDNSLIANFSHIGKADYGEDQGKTNGSSADSTSRRSARTQQGWQFQEYTSACV